MCDVIIHKYIQWDFIKLHYLLSKNSKILKAVNGKVKSKNYPRNRPWRPKGL
jgi:hypothetical protein